MRSAYGRSLIGSASVITVPNLRSNNLSICYSMNKNGRLYYKHRNNPYNNERFLEFTNNLLEQFEIKNISLVVLIMDK